MHEVLQVAFDWHSYHLHVFETVYGQFGAPDDDDDWSDRKGEATAALAVRAPRLPSSLLASRKGLTFS